MKSGFLCRGGARVNRSGSGFAYSGHGHTCRLTPDPHPLAALPPAYPNKLKIFLGIIMYRLATHRPRGPDGKETYTDISQVPPCLLTSSEFPLRCRVLNSPAARQQLQQPVCCLMVSDEAGVCDEMVLGSICHERVRVRSARTYLYIWGFTTGQHPTRLPRPLRPASRPSSSAIP